MASAQDSYPPLPRSNENSQDLLVYVDHVVTHFKLYSLLLLLFFNQLLVV